MPRRDPTDPVFLATYTKEKVWAPANGVSKRTAFEYRNDTPGLPFMIWAGEVWIHNEGGAAYIRGRIQRRNVRRRSARRAEITQATTTT